MAKELTVAVAIFRVLPPLHAMIMSEATPNMEYK